MRKINYALIKESLLYAQIHINQADNLDDKPDSDNLREGLYSSAWFQLWVASQKLPQLLAVNYGEKGFQGSSLELTALLKDKGINSPECQLLNSLMSDRQSFLQLIEHKIMQAITLNSISTVSVGFSFDDSRVNAAGTKVDKKNDSDELVFAISQFHSLLAELAIQKK